jgi:hypothetical protein
MSKLSLIMFTALFVFSIKPASAQWKDFSTLQGRQQQLDLESCSYRLKWKYLQFLHGSNNSTGTPTTTYFTLGSGNTYFTNGNAFRAPEQINQFEFLTTKNMALQLQSRSAIDRNNNAYNVYLQHIHDIQNPITEPKIVLIVSENGASLEFQYNRGFENHFIPMGQEQFTLQEANCPAGEIKGITATASSNSGTASRTVDGNSSNHWLGSFGSGSATLDLNLQKIHTLSELKIHWHNTELYQSKSFDVLVSSNNHNFSTIFSNQSASTNAIDLSGIKAQYIRLVLRNSLSGHAVIHEITVSGK